MKKLFTILTGCALSFAAIAGSPAHGVKVDRSKLVSLSNGAARAIPCDTLSNIDFNTADSIAYTLPLQSPSVGYADGNGGISAGPNGVLTITSVGEMIKTPLANSYVTAVIAYFADPILNASASDSILPVTAYIYDTTGTAYTGGVGPGRVLDSASVTTGFIARFGAGLFNFTHNAVIPGKSFFVMIKLPQVTGDTIIVYSTDGTSGNGHGYLGAGGVYAALSGLFQGNPAIGNYIFAGVCASSPNVGISDLSGVNELNVYPNPTFGKINVAFNMESASDVAISVTSITGSKVYETSEKAVSVYNKSLDLSGIAPGVYIVNIKTATGTINRRVSIQ